ncbi:ACT domain-containing protein [Ephemerocybe angulata]|uniref:ACT domain-containing protein n=1 Tax=Ephemerocybe angulata TaxID=980116 RepID=A0A8H6MFC3_9AGAR|nr:ACT domain-containing protein [Tulosesus angulatus]
MHPPSRSPSLNLIVLKQPFFVIQIEFFSITRTDEEVSVVGEIHEELLGPCIKIKGPMTHDLTGIMAAFTAPLKEAEVPIFAISTWNTDYVLVPTEKLQEACTALEKDGMDLRGNENFCHIISSWPFENNSLGLVI